MCVVLDLKYRKSVLRLLFVMLFSLLTKLSYSQEDETDYVFKHYTIENGLPSSLIKDVNIDNNGFVWIATQAGLSRFDGKRFVNYSSVNTGFIQNNRFVKIQRIKSGDLLVYNNENIVFKINKHSKLELDTSLKYGYNFTINGMDEIVFKSENLFLFDSMNNLNQVNEGCFVYDIDTFCFYLVDKDQIKFCKKGIYPQTTLRINHLFNFNVAFVLKNKLGIVNQKNEIVIIRNGKVEKVYQLEKVFNKKIDISKLRFNKNNDEVTMLYGSQLFKLDFIDDNLSFISLDKFGNMDDNVFKVDSKLNSQISLFFSSINGFYIVQKKLFKTFEFKSEVSERNETYRILVDEKNKPFSLFSHKLKEFSFINKFSLVFNITPSLLCTLNKDSIYYYNLDSNISKKYKLEISGSSKYRFYTDAYLVGDKVYIIETNRIFELKNGNQLIEVLKLPFIVNSCLISQKKYEWFLIKKNDGVVVYNTRSRKIKTINELKGKEVRFIQFDSILNTYWVFTYGYGIYVLDKSLKISKFYNDPGGYLNFSHYFLQDNRGNYWIPTNSGLIMIEKKEVLSYIKNAKFDLRLYKFNTKNGLINNEFNGRFYNSGIKLSDGRFALSSMLGIVEFDPNSFIPSRNTNPILVDNIEYNGNQLPDKAHHYLKEGFLVFKMNLALADIDFLNATNIEYNIPELGDKWTMLNNQELNLYSLKRGVYNLYFRKNKDEESINHKKITLIVQPAWYSSDFAYFSYGLFLILATIVSSKYFFKLKQNKIKQELLQLDNELKALRAQINPHYLSNSLVSLQNMLLDDDKEKVFDIIGNYGKVMRKMLEKSDDSYISLQMELDAIKEYIHLESEVHKTEIDVELNVDLKGKFANANDVFIPAFILQPFVENALIHGLFPLKEQAKKIVIHSVVFGNILRIEILDNGKGFAPNHTTHRKSYGIENVRKRIKLLEKIYKITFDFSIVNVNTIDKTKNGTQVTLHLPIKS